MRSKLYIKAKPRAFARGFLSLIGRLPTLPHTRACSTIGAERLNYRVRDGNGWDPLARITQKRTGERVSFESASPRLNIDGQCHCISTLHTQPCGHAPFKLARPGRDYFRGHYSVSTVKFYGQAERAISNGQLNALLRLHIRPINVIVFHGSSGRSHLREGFALICIQRLS